jgi:hypothetical protein
MVLLYNILLKITIFPGKKCQFYKNIEKKIDNLPPAARGRFLKKLPPWTPGKNF